MAELKYANWEKLTVTELRAYFGFNFLMGLVHLPAIEDYWKNDPYFHYHPIASRISRDRFRDISRYLHFTNNTRLACRGETGYDRLGKVRPVIECVQKAMREAYIPSRDIVVDEAMIPFQGRSSLKQFMPMKPVKRGIKVWCLADSSNGFVANFEVYTGRGEDVPEDAETTLGARVVISLTKHLKGKNHHVYCDNFFTSPYLFVKLHKQGFYANGTLRLSTKGLPSDLKIGSKRSKKAQASLGLLAR